MVWHLISYISVCAIGSLAVIDVDEELLDNHWVYLLSLLLLLAHLLLCLAFQFSCCSLFIGYISQASDLLLPVHIHHGYFWQFTALPKYWAWQLVCIFVCLECGRAIVSIFVLAKCLQLSRDGFVNVLWESWHHVISQSALIFLQVTSVHGQVCFSTCGI